MNIWTKVHYGLVSINPDLKVGVSGKNIKWALAQVIFY